MKCSVVVLVALCAAVSTVRPKVFGIGLEHTGLSSIRTALERIGYTVRAERRTSYFGSFSNTSSSTDERRASIARYSGVDAVVGEGLLLNAGDLLEAFPDSMFIMTVVHAQDDADAWASSIAAYLKDIKALYNNSVPFRFKRHVEMLYGGLDAPLSAIRNALSKHTLDARLAIPAPQLLIIDLLAGDGYDKICLFLRSTLGPCTDPYPDMPLPLRFDDALVEHKRDVQLLRRFHYINDRMTQQSKHAYVAILSDLAGNGSDAYFLSFLVAAESIRLTGSVCDIVLLVLGSIPRGKLDVLSSRGIRTAVVGAFGVDVVTSSDYNALDGVYRAKIRALQMAEYESVIFFDSDMVFHSNLDALFLEPYDILAYIGPRSPLNAGLFLLRPSWAALVDIHDVALSGLYTDTNGWMNYGPIPDWRSRAPGALTDWSFYGASVEQGLLYYYYFCYQEGKNARLMAPTHADMQAVTHFGGEFKPWVWKKKALRRYPEATKLWLQLYDSLCQSMDCSLPV